MTSPRKSEDRIVRTPIRSSNDTLALRATDEYASLEAGEDFIVVELREIDAAERSDMAGIVEAALSDDEVRSSISIDISDPDPNSTGKVAIEGEEVSDD